MKYQIIANVLRGDTSSVHANLMLSWRHDYYVNLKILVHESVISLWKMNHGIIMGFEVRD